MNGHYAQQLALVIQEELDQFEKNMAWILVPELDVEQDYKPLSEKWVFRVKQDINRAIAIFKAR